MTEQRYIKVDGHPGFVRDRISGAIININKQKIDQAKQVKRAKVQAAKRLDRLEDDMAEIKSMLQTLIKGRNDQTNS